MQKLSMLFVFCCAYIVAAAQSDIPVPTHPTDIAPGPTAAALGAYADVPVNHYTGLPSISVPLYTVQDGPLTVPISLSYHADGIQASEMASWVGLGWSLNAGGVITRTVRGLPDDVDEAVADRTFETGGKQVYTGAGYITGTPAFVDENQPPSGFWTKQYLDWYACGSKDGSPDMFQLNVGGITARFVFDHNGNIHLLSDSDLKIAYTQVQGGTELESFTVTTPAGLVYQFSERETMQYITLSSDNPDTDPLGYQQARSNLDHKPYTSAWYLSSISAPWQGRTVTFTYQPETFSYRNNWSRRYGQVAAGDYANKSYQLFTLEHPRLSQIDFSTGKVVLEAAADRPDYLASQALIAYTNGLGTSFSMQATAAPKALTRLKVQTSNGEVRGAWDFSYSQFSNTDGTYRLRLDQVKELPNSLNTASAKPPYSFTYNIQTLPAKHSHQLDYWGYYNANAATTSRPTLYKYTSADPKNTTYRSRYSIFPRSSGTYQLTSFGVSRAANETAAKAGVLTTVQYPTGGSDTFEYELHRFDFEGQEQQGGGLRIKTITRNYANAEGAANRVRSFQYTRYLEAAANSSGQIVALPVFAYERLLGTTSYDIFNSNARTVGYTHGSFVGYTEVSEVHPGNGRKVYAYDFAVPAGSLSFNSSHAGFHGAQTCDFEAPTTVRYQSDSLFFDPHPQDLFPFASDPNYDWQRGSLLSTHTFDEQDNLVSTTSYQYQVVDACTKLPTFSVGYVTRAVSQYGAGAWYSFANSYILTSRKHLTKTTTRTYDRDFSGQHLAAESEVFYDSPNHWLPTRTKTTNSDGAAYVTEMRYAPDFSLATAGPMKDALDALVTQHRIATPIEVLNWYDAGNGLELLGATFTTYNNFSGTTLPYEVYTFETDAPVPQAQVLNSATQTSFQLDNHYHRVVRVGSYDAQANPLDILPEYGPPAASIYGHGSQLPIAQVSNARASETGYTGFESDDRDLWTYTSGHSQFTTDAYTGTQALKVLPGNPVSFGGWRNYIPADENGVYILSCRIKTQAGFGTGQGRLVLHTIDASGSNAQYPQSIPQANTTVTFNQSTDWVLVETEIDLAAVRAAAGLSTSTPLHLHTYLANDDASHYFLADDIRFYPKRAFMHTATWQPLLGITSQTGPTLQPTTYTYDDFGRNETVKDVDGHIRASWQYNYHTGTTGHNSVATISPQSPVTTTAAMQALPDADKWQQTSFFDGLGRIKQQVLQAYTPDGADLVQPVTYDAHGRQTKQWLPYQASGTTGSYRSDFALEQPKFYQLAPAYVPKTDYAFAQTTFDNSPLNVPLEQGAQGAQWQLGTTHTTKGTYRVNNTDEVRQWTLSGTHAVSTSYWPVQALLVQESTDANGAKTLSYTDKLGRTLLTRQQQTDVAGQEYADTYYVYDPFGNLRVVIPPKAVETFLGTGNWNTATLSYPLAYFYTYDARQRMVEQTVPGAEPVYIVYDMQNRPVLTQDGNQRTKKKWSFVKYDHHSRPVYNGIFATTEYGTRAAAQAAADAAALTQPLSEQPDPADAQHLFGWSNNAFPVLHFSTTIVNGHTVKEPLFELLIANHYDGYDFDRDGTPDATWADNLNLGTTNGQGNTSHRGQLCGNRVKVLDNNHPVQWLTQAVFYNRFGAAIQVSGNNHLGGSEVADVEYNFALQPIRTLLTHTDGTTTTQVRNRFQYDASGRITHTYQQFNTDPEILLSQAQYNALGTLSEKNLHSTNNGTSFLQSIDYSFNIRGWLTHINNADLLSDRERTLDQLKITVIERLNEPGEEDGLVLDLELKTTDVQGNQDYHITREMALPLVGSDPAAYSNLKQIEAQTLIIDFVQQVVKDEQTLANAHTQAETKTTAKLATQTVTHSDVVNACNTKVCLFIEQTFTKVIGWTNDDANDLFGMDFKYTTVAPGLKANPLYNGNLAEVHWQSASDHVKRGFGYKYDRANRLLSAQYAAFNTGTQTWANELNRYNVSNITYDKNGNITAMQRNGYRQNGTFGQMDDLVYAYAGNRLTEVHDQASQHSYNDFSDGGSYASSEYTYDANGNQTEDANKRILITYNHLNLPTQVKYTNGNRINYLYAADGRKLQKKVTPSGGSATHLEYAGGFVYNDNGLEYVFTSEGRAVPENGTFRYEYHYRDHLGNTRLAFSDLDGDGDAEATTEIIQEAHYYPFGMELLGLGTPQVGPEHQYKFNDRELQEDFGLQWYSMDWRQLDPQLGRWTSIDPITNWFQTPYAGLDGNPIVLADPQGLQGHWAADYDQEAPWARPGHFEFEGGSWLTANFLGVEPGSGGPDPDHGQDSESSGSDDRDSKSHGQNYLDGFVGGLESTWNFLQYQLTWEGYSETVLNTLTLGTYSQIQGLSAFVFNPPSFNVNSHDLSYGAGFMTEKTFEFLVLRRSLGPFRSSVAPSRPLYHYTSKEGYEAIMQSMKLNPSVGMKNARYGVGQYFSDIAPGQFTIGQLSYRLYGIPWATKKLKYFIKIETRGLEIVKNRPYNYLRPSQKPLDLRGRVLSSGESRFKLGL